jgi:hypothetical protein
MSQFETSPLTSQPHQDVLKMAIALGLGVGLFQLAFLKPGIWGIDGNDMLAVAQSLVTEGDFSTSPATGVLGHDGQYYSSRYALLPIVAVPFVAVGLWLSNLVGLPSQYVAAVCALVSSVLLTVASTVMVALLALRLGSRRRGAYLAALGFAFGTTALVYAREFFAEPLLAFLTVTSFYLAFGESRKSAIGASVLAGLSIVAKPAGIVTGPILAAYFFAKKRPLDVVVSPLIGSAVGVALHCSYNYLRFANFFSSGQDSRISFEDVPQRFFGMLFSPGAGGGLLLYCPVVILAIVGIRKAFRAKPLEVMAIAGLFAGYLVLHSFWAFGGWNWGPRFLVPTLPALLALTALVEKHQRKWLVALTIIGFLINSPTLISFYQRYYAEAQDKGCLQCAMALWGSPLDAPIVRIWGATVRQLQDAFSNDVIEVFKSSGSAPARGDVASSDFFKILAVWWWMLPVARIPLWVGALLASALAGTGGWFLVKGWRDLRLYRKY